jgi:hypothetical protein
MRMTLSTLLPCINRSSQLSSSGEDTNMILISFNISDGMCPHEVCNVVKWNAITAPLIHPAGLLGKLLKQALSNEGVCG